VPSRELLLLLVLLVVLVLQSSSRAFLSLSFFVGRAPTRPLDTKGHTHPHPLDVAGDGCGMAWHGMFSLMDENSESCLFVCVCVRSVSHRVQWLGVHILEVDAPVCVLVNRADDRPASNRENENENERRW
jgi:hypothetical protein